MNLHAYLLPLEKGMTLYFIKLETLSPNDALVWLKLAQLSWRRRFLNDVNAFLLCQYYLPLLKGFTLHLTKKGESSSLKDDLYHV